MNRTSLRRADSSRQLDLFSFVPPVLPRRQPAPDQTPVVLPFPVRSDPPDPKPPEPTAAVDVPASAPFRILDRHRLGQGSLAQKCRDNLAALALLKRLEAEAMRERSTFTGIELDGLTTRLARALYPEADLRHSPFEEARLQPDSFDLAISNVPFGDYRPFDPRFPRLLIHDYFFAAALAWVRPGGLIAFITSRGTLDKQDATLRDLVAAQANLLGAIRLPNTAFKENANTKQQREDRGSRIVKELEKAT